MQLEASLQVLAQMEAEIRPRSEELDAKTRELAQRESAVAGLEKEKADVHLLKEVLKRRRQELMQMTADVAKRERAVSELEQALKDATAKLRQQDAHLDARERALDIREGELWQKKESIEALQATRENNWIDLHNEIVLLRKRVADLSEVKESPRKLTGPPKDMPPVEYVDFEILKPGRWDVEDVIKHYRKMARRMPAGFAGKRPDWRRLREILKLKPIKWYVGTKAWEGYSVLTFKRTTNVVLECPFEGNATYILDKNWERKARHTKQYVRECYDYGKIVHKGEWLDRVRDSLDDL